MNARRRLVPALAALAAAGLSDPALAAERVCPAPSVDASSAIVDRHPELVERIRTELSKRRDLDTCARVDLRAAHDGAIEVSVALPDGRTATRSAAEDEDVLPTLQALLLLPQPAPTSTRRTAPATSPGRAHRAPVSVPSDERGSTPAPEPRRVGVELSLIGGARMGGGQFAVGLGALSLLEAHGWLCGFEGRADLYRDATRDDSETALELALLGGKRFHFRAVALDFIAGPAIAMKGFATSTTDVERVASQEPAQPSSVRPPREDPSTGPVPRFLLAAHAGFAPREVLRSLVGVEATFWPARSQSSPGQRTASFPAFTLGVVLGGTLGTR